MRVPVVALVKLHDQTRYVRFGHQFCVRDGAAAVDTLHAAAFTARLHSPLQLA